ncbi:MAG TPA: YraN family protein [Acidimicrobiales bacterium]|nr:YraN family protein [Acidimicrobiales bacterium]
MTRGRLERGAAGEALAADWYVEQGYAVLDRNWRCRDGELDLVLRQGRTTVFCEVKTRTSTAFGSPAEAVTPTKQRRIRRLAAQWLGAHPEARGDVRFDVASVLAGRLEVIEAAF